MARMSSALALSVTLVISLTLAYVCGAHTQATASIGNCDPFGALPSTALDALVQKIKDQGLSKDKLAVLSAFALNNTLGLNADATTTILLLFPFSSDQVTAINIIKKFILGLICADAATIINSYSFSADKLSALGVIVNYVMDLKTNSSLIIDCFSFSSDKAAAQALINAAKPRSCLWGEITIDRFDFIIDVSGSMNERFTTPTGQTLSRLQFVQGELFGVMNGSLSSNQKFNIISFSDRATSWQPGVVPVTPANIASAKTFVQALSAGGGTYVLNALTLSMKDKEVKGVYLLSDGEPSDNPQAIISAAVAWGYPVNTIAFKAGDSGAAFLSQLAKATKGTFRAFK